MLDSVLSEGGDADSAKDDTVDSASAVDMANVLVVLNKLDLAAASYSVNVGAQSDARSTSGHDRLALLPRHSISCSTGQGIADLEQALAKAVQVLLEGGGAGDSPLITRERHRRHVTRCTEHLKRFLSGRLPMDAAAEELR